LPDRRLFSNEENGSSTTVLFGSRAWALLRALLWLTTDFETFQVIYRPRVPTGLAEKGGS
jgi:hypothetical protein